METGTMSPLLIPDASFRAKLENPLLNRQQTADFIARGTRPFELPGFRVQAGYQLRASLDGLQIRMIFDGETVYYVKLKEASNIIPGVSHITQVGVWRTRTANMQKAVEGLAPALFAWLVERYNVVISDDEQTRAGQRFWQYRLSEALDNPRQHVYGWDGTKEDAEPEEITNTIDLVDHWEPLIWGTERDVHNNRLFIITGSPLR
ncbi:hypothetical protein ID007_004308 [Salmonella enterica]|nr:hypothetical protein [Salmonella enterica]